MTTPFLGEIKMFGGNFAIRGWAFCNGQILAINQNQALFALLATTYGGNGTTTFALPDLRSRVPVHFGQGPGLPNYPQGQVGGVENVTLTANQLPTHNHTVAANSAAGTQASPANNFPAGGTAYAAAANTVLSAGVVNNTGSNQPHPNIQPHQVVYFLIALQGIFPSRN
ncbi:MAG: tail fiber protein [Blastocatellia bacterium]|nr:tail fiber protein [Blastocatellia bacterium]